MVRISGTKVPWWLGVTNVRVHALIKNGQLRPLKNAKHLGDMEFDSADVHVLKLKLAEEKEKKNKANHEATVEAVVQPEPTGVPVPTPVETPKPEEKPMTPETQQAQAPTSHPINTAEAAKILGITAAALGGVVFRTKSDKDYFRPVPHFHDRDGKLWFRHDEMVEYRVKWDHVLHPKSGGSAAQAGVAESRLFKKKKEADKKAAKEAKHPKTKKSMTRKDACHVIGVDDLELQALLKAGLLKSLLEEDVISYMEMVAPPKVEKKEEPKKEEAPLPPKTTNQGGPPFVNIQGKANLTPVVVKQLMRAFPEGPPHFSEITEEEIPQLELLERIWEGPDKNQYTGLIRLLKEGYTLQLVRK